MELEIICALCKPRYQLSAKITSECIAIIIKQYEYGIATLDMKKFIEWRQSTQWSGPTAPSSLHENRYDQAYVFHDLYPNAMLIYNNSLYNGISLFPVLKERQIDPMGNDYSKHKNLGISPIYYQYLLNL